MPLDVAEIQATAAVYVVRTFWALVVTVVTLVVSGAIRGVAVRAFTRRRADPNAIVLLGRVAQLLIIVLGALVVIAIYTRDAFGWILTSFSVVGLVIGLSLQDILRNFFAGVWILVERPFRIGESIQLGAHAGVVQEISFRTTSLRTDDGRQVIVPNASLMTDPLVNLSRFPARGISLLLSLPADDATADVEQHVRSALESLAAAAPRVELRSVAEGRARYGVTIMTEQRETALSAAVAALRARFPQGEVTSA